MDRHQRRVGGRTILAKCRQDHIDDLLVMRQNLTKRLIETTVSIIVRGRCEFVIEPKPIKEASQHGVVVMAEARMRAERIGYLGQRHPNMLFEHLPVRDILRRPAKSIHIIAERQQPRRQAGQFGERLADPSRAGDLRERADMRQAGRSITSLEQNRRDRQSCRQDFLCLIDRPRHLISLHFGRCDPISASFFSQVHERMRRQ